MRRWGAALALASGLAAAPQPAARVTCGAEGFRRKHALTRHDALAPGDPIRPGEWLQGRAHGGAVEASLGAGGTVSLRTLAPTTFQLVRVSPTEGPELPGRLTVKLRRGRLLVCAPELEAGARVTVWTTWGDVVLEGPGTMLVRVVRAASARRRAEAASRERAEVLVLRGRVRTRGAYEGEDQAQEVPPGYRDRVGLWPDTGDGSPRVLTPAAARRLLRPLEATPCPEACATARRGSPTGGWLRPERDD